MKRFVCSKKGLSRKKKDIDLLAVHGHIRKTCDIRSSCMTQLNYFET